MTPLEMSMLVMRSKTARRVFAHGLTLAALVGLPLVVPGAGPAILAPAAAQEAGAGRGAGQGAGRSGGPRAAARPAASPIRRMPDGKPDLSGVFQANAAGSNQGLEPHEAVPNTPGGRGFIIDPADGKLPYQPWARAENDSRGRPERGYDDPTAHCFPAGVPRSFYVPSPFQILQPPGYVVILYERMWWRTVPLDGRAHIPDSIRLWQGDSVGHWEGDTLVIETANLNGRSWLDELGGVVTHGARVVERLTPIDGESFRFEATVTDPAAFTRPWTLRMDMRRMSTELLEVACLEDDQDLPHLKDVRDEFRRNQKK
jgi:hypothetical protein